MKRFQNGILKTCDWDWWSAYVVTPTDTGFHSRGRQVSNYSMGTLTKTPFHLHTCHFMKQIINPVRVPMEIYVPTKGTTRLSAKMRDEIDLTKPRLSHVFCWTEILPMHCKVLNKKIEYKGVPKYYSYCRLEGHTVNQCQRCERDKEEATEGTQIGQGNS